MFSRFCKLCNNSLRISVLNLRKYRVSTIRLQEHLEAELDNEEPEKEKEKDKDARVPIIISKRPEFHFYRGKTFSKFETTPLASQGWHNSKSVGDHFTIYPVHHLHDESEDLPEELASFEEFCLHPKLIENLEENKLRVPSDIQILGIPKLLSGQHTLLSAETGCGKTLTFILPILDQIQRWKSKAENLDRRPNSPFCIIITPSRELADQIGRVSKQMKRGLDIDVRTITGGRTKRKMRNSIVENVDLLIGTFGVISKMISNKIYKLNFVRHVVLDEAHALFDETFEDKLNVLLRKISFDVNDRTEDLPFPTSSQLTLVSATTPSELPEYLAKIINPKSLIHVMTDNVHRIMVPQKFMRLTAADKPMALLKIVKHRALKKHPFIIFSNDSSTCDWISLFFNEFNIRTIHLNGEMPMPIRKGKFAEFQRGEYNVLSTTNAGARGLDTINVNDVINYDFPMETADYIHRCGRTGRLGTKGDCRVTNLISRPLEINLTQKLERAARRMRPIPIFNMIEEEIKLHTKKQRAQEINTESRKKNMRKKKL